MAKASVAALLALTFAIHHSPFTTHHSPFTTRHSPVLDPEILRPTGGLPAHVVGKFQDPTGFQQSRTGDYFIFDRRSHAVFSYTPAADAPRMIVAVGVEKGRVLQPSAFDLAPDDTFVLADAPGRQERIQMFLAGGAMLGGFSLPTRAEPRLTMGDYVLNGIGSLEYTGTSILISQPETGALVTEYGTDGRTKRTFGELRKTGHETDRELHVAMNVGLPIVNPKGGFYFVFLAGTPMFRKYDDGGKLLFERHIEGAQLDDFLKTLPTTWVKRRIAEGEVAVMQPTVRTAAADRDGNLWISLAVAFTYVYDGSGDKRRVVQFRATDILRPASLFFTKDNRVLVTPGCYAFPTSTSRRDPDRG